jgi:hypothetical protein
MCRVRARSVWVCLFLVASFIVGCSPKSTPPGANSFYGGVDVARFSYHYWDEGLAILIWHDFAYGGEGCSGSGSTEDPVYRLKCDVESGDGRSFSWKAHTQDGVTADMWIEDQSYDLSQGSLFLVSSKDDGVQVEQLQRDLSELEPTVDTISATSYSDSDVAGFIARIRTEGDSPGVDDKDGLAALIDALQLAGQTVEIAGPVDQPFFSVPGQIIVVNGQDVQVFEYPDGAAAQAEAAQISPDASSVGTSIVSWAATPHFYAQDRVIVLYVGDDHAVVDALNDILGQPVAEGMGVPLSPPNTATLVFDALAAADYEALLRLMDETFAIGYWLSEGQTLTPAQAVEQLRLNLLPDPASVSFIRDRAQFPDLGNVDPATAFGPDVQIVDLVYSQGWGADGLGEAILTIGEGADGSQFWHGIIYTSAGFAAPPGPPDMATLLSDAFAAADYDALPALMGESFAIGYWLSEGQTLTPAQAVEQLRLNLLPDPAAVSFVRDRSQFPDLGGVDPATVFGPDVQIVDLVYSQGWGTDGLQEAILTIAQNPDGSQYWHGMLYGRFAELPAPPGPLKTATLLSDAFAAADYEAMQGLMGEIFAIGYWLSEGQRLTPAQAVEQLRLNLLLDPAAVSFIRDRSQFPDLDPAGVDPATVFGPDVQIVDLVYSQGWGTDGLQEAILAIAQNPDGSQYWHGMLYGRFAELPVPPGQEPPSYESAVYRNPENGFELDYPASWHLDDQVLGSRASGALFYVEDTDEEPIFSAVVFLWDPRNDLDAWVDQRRQAWSGSRVTVLSEEELTVAGGHRAIQFELQGFDGQTTNYLFMEVGDRYLELFGTGDLEEFGEIIGTLRFGESGS